MSTSGRRPIEGLGVRTAGNDIAEAAIAAASNGWAVFPLNGKVPAVKGGRGVLDATTDPAEVAELWRRYPGANIGARVSPALFVIDIDPRNGGAAGLAEWTTEHGPMPTTLTTWSGRGDGGHHLFYRHPGGKLSARRLPTGIDLKTSTGYTVIPPSIHPDTGRPYRLEVHPIAPPPAWLVALLRLPVVVPGPVIPAKRVRVSSGPSAVAAFNEATSWADILGPHGWRVARGTGDDDGSVWLHPAATSSCSATVRGERLYVYSPNTPFDVTESGAPRGYSRFEAHAVLRHGGDMSAAARHFRTTGAVS